MPVRTVRNVTSLGLKRERVHNGKERVTHLELVSGENNTNIVGADVSAGNPIAYFGFDHIPEGQAQYDVNSV